MNGILIINKEKGFTSHDAVAKLRGILRMKKIGHTGTLDPDATGVLPVCLGNATGICELLTDRTKEYVAGVQLGITTDTQDITGTILRETAPSVSSDALNACIRSFLGEYDQLTPMYSARKINGQKLVDLARKGLDVERPVKRVRINEAELTDYDEQAGTFTLRVVCSKGTYIRTLCNDIGEKLGCGACMTSLTRTKSGEFSLSDAHTLSEIENAVRNDSVSPLILPTDSVFTEYPVVHVTDNGRKFLLNGNPLSEDMFFVTPAADTVRVYDGDAFTALYEKKGSRYFPKKMFL